MIENLDDLITSAVLEFFGTMLNMNTKPVVPKAADVNGEMHVAGSVGFTGMVTGVVYTHTTLAFARRITSTLLGITDAEIEGDDMVNDAVGEMANMLVGQVKSRLCDRGQTCVLTVPSVVRGRSLRVEPIRSTERHVYAFEAEGNHIFIEAFVKPN
jgi:chemotaxis protein CheX